MTFDADDEWLQKVASITQWKRGGERAPHKPLLLLYALARLQRQRASTMVYREVEPELDQILSEFGPPKKSSPSYPFHYLVSDGLWIVTCDEGPRSPGDARGRLRSTNAVGRLDPSFERALIESPSLLARVSRLLLDANFEPTVQGDLIDQLGLDIIGSETNVSDQPVGPRRDPKFRSLVLVAYEYRCAMCGLDPQIDNMPVAIDAAHVKWWSAGGPDTLANGLCLCSLHHKLFDRGVMGLGLDRRILVSERFRGSGALALHMVLGLSGREIDPPQAGKELVHEDHIAWHRHQVFRGEPRAPAA